MPDLKQLLKEAAAQGATTQQLDIIYNAYQDDVKKKAQSTASLTGGVGSVPGLEPFQQFKPGVNKYVRQPAPVAPGIRNQGQAPKTVAQAQKEKPVPFSQEAFKQAAPQGISPSTANRMGAITSTASGFYRIPELIYSTFAAPQNLAADILDKPELRANYDAISKGTYNPLGVIDKTADYLQQSSVDWEKNKRKYNENITTQLMNGDFQGAARQIGDQIESSIPGMLSMYLTGPLAAAGKFAPTARTLTMAAPFAGSQLNAIKDNPNIPDYLKPLNAWLNGTAEVVLEEQFGTKALVDDALRIAKTEGREAAVNTIKNVLRPLGERFIKKVQPITNVLGNGLEEGITTFSQNVIDKYTGVDPNRGLFDNVPDSIIVGTAQGTGVTALGKGMDVLTNPKNQVKIDALSKQRDDLMNDLDSPSIPDNIKGDLVDKLTDINEEINIVLDENRAEYDALSDDDIGTLKTLNDQIDDRVDLLNNTSLSETSRQLAQNDLVALQKELATKQKDVSTKVKQFKTKANAVQEPSTTGQVPPVIEGGENLQEGGEGVGQSIQGTQAPQEVTIQEPTAEIKPEEKVNKAIDEVSSSQANKIKNGDYSLLSNFTTNDYRNNDVARNQIIDKWNELKDKVVREYGEKYGSNPLRDFSPTDIINNTNKKIIFDKDGNPSAAVVLRNGNDAAQSLTFNDLNDYVKELKERYGDFIVIDTMFSLNKNGGAEALSQLKQVADKNGVNLILRATEMENPFNGKIITPTEKLKTFYENNGFEPVEFKDPRDTDVFIYKPKEVSQAPQEVITQEEVVSKGLPKATSKFEAVEVIDYTKPELNKYKPSEQLKFNQGTYEPVRLVGNEDLITLIQAGSERATFKKIKNVNQEWVDKNEKEFGISAIDAYNKAREIAKANRDINTERIVILGDKIAPQVSQAEVKFEEKAPTKALPAKKTKELAKLVKEGNIDEFLKQINNIGDVEFSTKIIENTQDQSFDAIVDEMNQLGDTKVAFSIDDEISDGGTIDIEGVQEREGLVKKPKYVKISDFAGKPIMLTISDQLSSGNTVNSFTGNPVEDLNGGLFFNYTKGNTESGWAYTDLDTANDVLNIAKELYNNNPELYPDGIVPTAVVKMGEDSITSNEAIARVLSDNLKSFPEANKKAAFVALKTEVKRLRDASIANANKAEASGELNKNAKKDSKIYSSILDYLDKYKTFDEAVDYNNIKTLAIATRPYLIKRFTVGQPSVALPKITKGAIKTDITKALFKGLPLDMVKGIHLAHITNTVSEKSLDNVPARHVMAFVGIDAKADAPIKSNHPNYPYALKGKGLGIVKNTKHLASVFPQAYGNAISKYLSGKAETPSKSVSQAIFGGLKDVLYRNKSLNVQNDNVSKLIGFMNVAFPSVRFMSDANSWNDIINSENVQKHIVNGETIYGLTTNGDIYLNPDFKDLNTPIHEMGHIWIDFVQTTNQNLYNKGLQLVDNTPEFEASKKVYGDTDKARKEALAILIGNRGETIANASQKSKFKKWLLGMWEYVQSKFPSLRDLSVKEIENLTLDQFVGGVLKDIVGGKEITKDLSALKMSDQFRGEVNFKSVKADAVGVLSRMLKSKLITQEQYNNAMERVGATTSIRNAEVEAKRADYGFPEPAQRPFQSNKTTLEKAKQAIKDGVSVNEVIEKALNREPITDVESAMLSLYQGTKEAELLKSNSELEKMQSSSALDFTEAVDKRNKIIDDLVNAYNAGEVSGNVSARALQARKIKVLQDDSLANMLIQKRKANNNRKLTNKQVDDITKLYTKIQVTKAALEAKIEKLNEENAKLKLKAAAPKIVSEVKVETTGKTKEQLKAEREDIFKQMSELARKSLSNLSMNPIPAEMIPLVVKLAKNYLATGAKTLDEVIDKVHADLSGYIENVSKNDIRRTLADYDADTRPTKEDIQDEVFGERSKEKQIKDIEDLEQQARKEKDPETAQLLQDEANAKRTAMEKQAEKDGLNKEQARLDNYKKNIKKRIEDLQGKLKKGDYSKTPKNEIKLDDEARKLKKQLEDIKFDFAVEIEKDALKSRGQLEKAVDIVVEVSNTPRALLATADFSAPLRQAAVATVAYPDIAAKAANEMMVQWASSEKAEQWMDDLMESPGYKLMQDSGLYVANIRSAKLSAKEEDFATNLASKIPGAGKLVDASERAYVAYLNKMRVDIFNQGVELLQNDGYSFATNPKAYKTLANYVNAITGRGSLGGGALEKAGPALNVLMFSPRLLASRVRLLTMLADPRIYKKENRVVRNMYLKDMSRFVGFGLTVLALAAAAGAEVEDDPRSTDFGKIKVGDTRWDIWGGFQQPIRAFVQATTEERKSTTTGKIVKLDGSGYGGETGGDVILRFFRGKLAPVPAFLVNAYTGKDVMGRPFELGPAVLQMSYPLVIQSIIESAKKDGVVFGVLATGVPSLLGVGVQTYGANDFLKQGVDDKAINLLLSKKAIAIEPNELDTKVFDVNTGEDRKMTDEEFKKYYADWADYIKMKLNDNYDEYKDMSVDEFETEFRSIKSEATKLAKEDISGVSNTTKTISYREGDESESYKLTPEELKYRQSLNEQYISRHGNIYNKEFKDAIRNGKSEQEADIIANKRLMSKANEYSRKIILRQHKSGRGYDF
jgi:hypothetical protein